jgi:hypothetical protein
MTDTHVCRNTALFIENLIEHIIPYNCAACLSLFFRAPTKCDSVKKFFKSARVFSAATDDKPGYFFTWP